MVNLGRHLNRHQPSTQFACFLSRHRDPPSRPRFPGFSLGQFYESTQKRVLEIYKFTKYNFHHIYIYTNKLQKCSTLVCKFWKESHYNFQTLLLGRLMSLQLPYLFQLWRISSQSKHTSLWMLCQQQLKSGIYVRLSFGYSVADESGKEMEIQPGTLVTCRTSAELIRAIRAHFANRANNKCLYFRVLDLYPLRVLDLYPLRVLDLYPKPAKHHQNLQGCGKKHVGSAASPSEDSISSSWKSASWEST